MQFLLLKTGIYISEINKEYGATAINSHFFILPNQCSQYKSDQDAMLSMHKEDVLEVDLPLYTQLREQDQSQPSLHA